MGTAQALVASVVVPIGAALLILAVGSDARVWVRRLALMATMLTLLLALFVVAQFDPSGDVYLQKQIEAGGAATDGWDVTRTGFAVTRFAWLPASSGLDVGIHLGLDGLSVWLYLLSAVLMLTAVLVSWQAIEQQSALFYSMLLLLEAGCLGVFAARDVVLFYVFFEFTLIPLFFLIGIWGSEQRQYAAQKFFLFTLVGSLITFLGLLALILWDGQHSGTGLYRASIPDLQLSLARHPLPPNLQVWVFLALLTGFAIKVPLFPLHSWLPLAHVQAPTAGSVFLAGILLKIGTYGFLRFNIPLLPDATAVCVPALMWVSVIGIVYGAMVALVQSDIKRLIAYSSVSHLGFCMLGLFALNPLGVQGAALQMVNHGISTGALFAIVGMLYERYHTREIVQLSGVTRRLPIMAFFMLLFTFSSIGLPGLNGFAGEILVLTGAFQRGWADTGGTNLWQLRCIAVLALTGVILGAWYMLWLVQRVFFGPVAEPHTDHTPRDLSGREIAALVPLAVCVVWIGLWPGFFLDRMAPALDGSISRAAVAWDRRDRPMLVVAHHPSPFEVQEVAHRAH